MGIKLFAVIIIIIIIIITIKRHVYITNFFQIARCTSTNAFLIDKTSKFKHNSVALLLIFHHVLVKGFELGSERKAGTTTKKRSRVPY